MRRLEVGLDPFHLTPPMINDSKTNSALCLMRVLSDLLEDKILSNDFDLFFINETWISYNTDENWLIRQIYSNSLCFDHLSFPRTYRKEGGLAIIKKQLNITIISHGCSQSFEDVWLQFRTTELICLPYRPPIPNTVEFWKFLYEEVLPKSLEFRIVVVDDLNLPHSKALTSFLEETLLTQLVNEPTHRSGNVLELILTNDNERVSDFCQELSFSDHKLKVQNIIPTQAQKL